MSEKTANNKLDEVLKKLDILVVVQLANSGLTRKEIAVVLGVSEKTIERMLPFAKLGQKRAKK
jgi:DNA-binding transcriptional regulator LsrR (DeoR family)